MDKEVPIDFGGNTDLESESRPYSHWRTYAVSDCSGCIDTSHYTTLYRRK